ncbi:MAG: hypothetical protein H8D94_00640 [Candidatus Pelagibacter sp.]|nr:hypothetical protein [Candidatus Pelagibacter sp.]
MTEYKFPSETIDLPSKGKLYSKDSPLSTGKIEIKYMTAKEEDILTSQNLIKKGVVIDRLLDSLIMTQGVTSNDLILGDKNAVMVAIRILAYGPEYAAEIKDPDTGATIEHTFNLADCPFKHLPDGVKNNEFDIELPISKQNIKFRLLTGKEEKQIEQEVKSKQKIGNQISSELTTRLKYSVISIDGETDKNKISVLVENMLSRDSVVLRNKIAEVSPDIELKQDMEIGGTVVEVDIPLTTEFFWPSSIS